MYARINAETPPVFNTRYSFKFFIFRRPSLPELPTGTRALKTRVPVTPLVGGVGVAVPVAVSCYVTFDQGNKTVHHYVNHTQCFHVVTPTPSRIYLRTSKNIPPLSLDVTGIFYSAQGASPIPAGRTRVLKGFPPQLRASTASRTRCAWGHGPRVAARGGLPVKRAESQLPATYVSHGYVCGHSVSKSMVLSVTKPR